MAPVSDGLRRARLHGQKITDARQANAAIVLVLKTLRQAVDLLSGFTFADKAAGFSAAYAARMEQQIDRTRSLQNELRLGFDRALADKIGLALVQSSDLLRDVRRDVAKSQAEGAFSELAREFAAAMREILEGAGRLALGALPTWIWIGVAWWALDRWSPAQRRELERARRRRTTDDDWLD